MFKHYTMNQVILPLDLEIKLDKNDIAFAVNDLIESIPEKSFEEFVRNTGCPAYHPRMMMKVILCAYTQSVFSGRKIEALIHDSVRMMWLAQDYVLAIEQSIDSAQILMSQNYFGSVSSNFVRN